MVYIVSPHPLICVLKQKQVSEDNTVSTHTYSLAHLAPSLLQKDPPLSHLAGCQMHGTPVNLQPSTDHPPTRSHQRTEPWNSLLPNFHASPVLKN